jgi:hypothetical protein
MKAVPAQQTFDRFPGRRLDDEVDIRERPEAGLPVKSFRQSGSLGDGHPQGRFFQGLKQRIQDSEQAQIAKRILVIGFLNLAENRGRDFFRKISQGPAQKGERSFLPCSSHQIVPIDLIP